MTVNFHAPNSAFQINNEKAVAAWIEKIVSQHKHTCGDVNIIFMNDEEIKALNKRFLNHDYATDVITFPYNEQGKISGDIVVGFETVRDNSLDYKVDFSDELHRVIIHGIFHLMGWNDHTPEEKRIMRRKEDEALDRFPRNN